MRLEHLLLLSLLSLASWSKVDGKLRANSRRRAKAMNARAVGSVQSLFASIRALIPAENEEAIFPETPRVHVRDLQELNMLGSDPDTENNPLQMCEGDCDEDADCDVGLICFQRDPYMAVPGCVGGEEEDSRTDFCILDPAAVVTTATLAPSSSSPATPTTTLESATALPATAPSTSPILAPSAGVPFAFPTTLEPTEESTAAPTILNETPTIATGSINVSAAPVELDIVGRNGEPRENYPLGLCQGDCDSDDDCQVGLICFVREPNEPVPGCIGEDSSRSDYCIPDPNTLPAATPAVPTALPAASPVDPTALPVASPTIISPPSPMPTAPTFDIGPSSSPTTYAPTAYVPTAFLSDYPSTVPSDFPSFVPTFTPVPTNSEQPTGTPTGGPTAEPKQGVQLKLYWEQGYLWQGETIERKWCMIHNYRGFPGTGKCWYGLETKTCDPNTVYVARCDSDDRQMFSVYPLPGGIHYQIGVYKENLCLERLDYAVSLQACDALNPLQRFYLPRGAIASKRFELSPITMPSHCLTQAHHPKSGEVLQLFRCSDARNEKNQNSFWQVY